MRFSTLLPVGFASVAVAIPDFAIGTQILFTATNQAQMDSVTKALVEAQSSWQASVTAQPEWSSAWSALVDFQKTHKGVPDGVTASDTIIEYESTPTWYTAMPTDLQNYLNKNQEEQTKLYAQVIKDATGDASGRVGMGVYVHGAFVALIAGVAVAL